MVLAFCLAYFCPFILHLEAYIAFACLFSSTDIGAIPFEFCSILNRCMSNNRNKTQQSKMGENHTRMSRNGTPAASNNEF